MLGIDGKVHTKLPKRQILTVVLQNCKKLALKHSIEEPAFLCFVDSSPGLSE